MDVGLYATLLERKSALFMANVSLHCPWCYYSGILVRVQAEGSSRWNLPCRVTQLSLSSFTAMSAYGAIARPATTTSEVATPTSYILPSKQALTVFPCTRASVDEALIAHLAGVFNEVVREGRTYPQQEALTHVEFASLASLTRLEIT